MKSEQPTTSALASADAAAAAAAEASTGEPLPPYWRSARLRVSVLLFMALMLAYALRVLLSVAIINIAAEFGYTNTQQGLISSSFFIGYLFLQVPGGWAASTWGGWGVLLAGVLAPSALTLATPPAAGSLPALVAMRVLTGLGEGVTYPCVHALLGAWTPAAERSRTVGSVWAGAFMGTVVALPLSGVLVAAAGWRSAFFFFGGAGLAWAAAWAALGASAPEKSASCGAAEAAYIARARGAPRAAGAAVPWAAMAACPAVWALALQHATHNYLFYMLLTWLPSFLKDELNFDVEKSGAVAVLPYIACFAIASGAGFAADAALSRGAPPRAVRLTVQAASELLPAAAILAAGFVTSAPAVVALLTAAVGFSGAGCAGYGTNHLDIAPHIAGILLGISNTLATIPGIVAPIIVGDLVAAPHDDAAHWRLAFAIAAAVAAAGFAVFAVFGRAEPLPELAFGPSDADRADAATADGAHAALLAPEGEASINY